MGRIYLVRHAQASALSDDYDQLSEQGVAQSCRLGDWFSGRGTRIDHAYSGTLKRQVHTLEHCLGRMARAPAAQVDAGFDEYRFEELFANSGPDLRSHEWLASLVRRAPDPRQQFQALVSNAFDEWLTGKADERRSRTWQQFRATAVAAIGRVASSCHSGQAAIAVSSGGVITAICQELLGIPDARIASLHWVLYNASVTTLLCQPGRMTLASFNNVSHLEGDEQRTSLLTYR